MRTIIARNLHRWRELKRLKQREVAEMAGVSMKRYQKYEEGRALPSLGVAKSLAEVYGMKVDDLITEYSNQNGEDKDLQ